MVCDDLYGAGSIDRKLGFKSGGGGVIPSDASGNGGFGSSGFDGRHIGIRSGS
jgi:hypothetical protein